MFVAAKQNSCRQ